ncbi:MULTISPECIES: DUF6030 family protein [unclassified Agrobacterium]|uniref:DUF6030 family protein n=1 Tax=unclassified Agrobacterium TaxID=2632611 RepID=UPI0024470BB3|nr:MULTISPECIES: DUF6030 family protein [unclassified Agrobacterium]MDH0613153.1 DUF6030 family protein [Agrobacterium sp. GD03872]MDH0695018.1 DUF6030 family protein [Agrobacterium sp. GD03871]MDH1057584.1 DUF6030 family protein [Agrobacterium sp. GD03992]MDH2208873.1 DUF6030 family protein [Agrobacterium sp. GD03643]MDH2218364.1 DUF6030 family protein [Agrobacterium sp. GD03638]
MDAGLQKRVSHGALLFAVVAVCLAIGATVLLANDKKHLKNLLTYLNLTPAIQSAEPPRMKPVKRQKLATRKVYLPPQLLKFEQAGDRASFARDFVLSGKELCDRFTATGFSNPQGWHSSPVNIRSFECTADLAAGNATDPAERASLFLEIRGEASGEVRSIRMKAVAPRTPDGTVILTKLDDALTMIVEQTRFADLSNMLEPARRMQPYQAQHFGISVSIKPEPTAPHRLNVILLASEQSPGLKLTRSFFDRDRWLRPANLPDRPALYPSVRKDRAP